KKTLEVLREPIEDRQITVSRANATLTFPSSIILVAAMNEVTSITIQCNDEREAIVTDNTQANISSLRSTA
ncbi:ATP-binding protein, partial [Selenomonas sp. oral taxon 138]